MRYVFIILYIFVPYVSLEGVFNSSNKKILRDSQVMSETWGGRFGDQLLLLLTTLWVSEKYEIPFVSNLSQPFQELSIYDQYTPYITEKPHVICKSEDALADIQKPSNIHISYGYKDNDWSYDLAFHDWASLRSNRPFLEKFRSLIRLKQPEKYDLIRAPKNLYSIAVHIRCWELGYSLKSMQVFPGAKKPMYSLSHSSVGNSYIDIYYPLKFPPVQYYIDQLNYLSSLFPERVLYVFLFSNYPQTNDIAEVILDNLEFPERFQIDWRRHSSEKNSLRSTYEDFYSLLNFDCLIRSGESNFSQMAHVAKDYQCVIFPTAYYWKNDCLHMANIHVEIDNKLTTILNEISSVTKHDTK